MEPEWNDVPDEKSAGWRAVFEDSREILFLAVPCPGWGAGARKNGGISRRFLAASGCGVKAFS